MIITRTPYRISFFGGGTDYPKWYLNNGGAVLSTSINKYCYINTRFIQNFFDYKFRIVWSYIENRNKIDEINHPCVREMLKYLNYNFEGIEIKHSGDLPARSGIGSSSSFTVGLLNALNNLVGVKINKKNICDKAIYFEQKILKENVGSQDQVAATYGGFNKINFTKKNKIKLEKTNVSKKRLDELNSRLMLFYSGIPRNSELNAKKIVKGIDKNSKILFEMKNNVDEALNILKSKSNINLFGELLHHSWEQKKSLAKTISNSKINEIYSEARQIGSTGGKLLGSGNGGFLLLFVPKKNQKKIKKKFYKLLHVPFNFEDEGSKVIFKSEQ